MSDRVETTDEPEPAKTGSVSFDVSTVEELDELNRGEGWSIDYRQLEAGPLNARYSILETRSGALTFERFDRRLEVRCEAPPGMVALFYVRDGEALVNGRRVTESDWTFLPRGAELTASVPARLGAGTTFVPEEDFERAFLGNARGSQSPPGDLLIVRDDSARAAALRRRHKALTAGASREGGDAEPAEWVGRTVAGMANGPSPRRMREDSRQRLDEAREYIESRIVDPLRLSDVCRECDVGMRSLQRYFKRELGLTPKRYITARRLDLARRALLRGTPESTDVTSVALRLGFHHLGRFSTEYRRFFGELPRQTLQHRSRSAVALSLFG
jgi:AraC-like DNA-binding protein